MSCSYNLTNEDITKHGGQVIEAREVMVLFGDLMLISGELPRQTTYELGSPAECPPH